MDKIKVAHVTFDMAIGGTEQVIKQLVLNSDHELFEHIVICIDGKIGAIGEQLIESGIAVKSLSRQPKLDFNMVGQLRRLIKDEQVKILHCHQYTPFFYGYMAGFMTAASIIFTEHGRFYPDVYRYKRLLVNPLMAVSCKAITAISQATKLALAQYEFMPKSRIELIYNGIKSLDVDEQCSKKLAVELGLKPDDKVLGTVSRLDPIKNHKLLIESFFEISREDSSVKLLIVGDGPLRNDIESQIERLGLQEKVIMTGYQNNPAPYMAIMDIFLLPSFSEGTSMTLLEVMSLGIPSIVSNVGGNTEVITHGENGLVFESDNLSACVDCISSLIYDDELMKTLSNGAVEIFGSKFEVSNMVTSFESLYK